MAYILQSKLNNDLYHNGTIIKKKGITLALFDVVGIARQFDTSAEANDVSQLFDVPVTIVEF